MATDVLLRSAMLGAAAGARSMTPLAALAAQRPGWLRAVAGLAALGELGADKLPQTPSRLKPAPLAGRIVAGALAGGGYARRRGAGVVVPALAGGAAAAAASYAGALWRAAAAQRSLGVPAALAEDAAAVALAWAATRRPA
jgi:uncharacterized membrane protein